MKTQNLLIGYLLPLLLFLGMFMACTPPEMEPDPPTPPPMEEPDDDDDDDDDGSQAEPRTYSTAQFPVGDLAIEIYLPSDYEEGKRYPTLYFNDGDFFAEIFGSLTSLEAEPFIMVGLWDGNSRASRFSAYEDDELSLTYSAYVPSTAAYTEALVNEVIPFVEDRYPSSKRALFGISLGGLHATWAGIKYPGTFTFIGAMSPSFWVGNGGIFNESLEALRPQGLSATKVFYIDRGTSEWRDMMPMITGLKQVELTYGQNIFYYEVPGADHNTSAWLARIENPFRLFLEGLGDLEELDISGFCVDNLDSPGSNQARINPLVTYSNGITFSVMTETEFEVVSGEGSVQNTGTYSVSSGTSMTVRGSYMGLSGQVVVDKCE